MGYPTQNAKTRGGRGADENFLEAGHCGEFPPEF
jgi:hypothetical protein